MPAAQIFVNLETGFAYYITKREDATGVRIRIH